MLPERRFAMNTAGMAPPPLTLQQLLTLIQTERAVQDLRRYFSLDVPSGSPPAYTGGRFEALGGGGDRPRTANKVTADDLVAVQMLSVLVPGPVALNLLEGGLGEQMAHHLTLIPVGVAVSDPAAAALIGPAGPAEAAWQLLEQQYDLGYVTAGKLLARKRPELIPVWDRVVRCAMGYPPPQAVWQWFHERMSADNGALTQALIAVRDTAGVTASVTPLRTLDVIVWMRHRSEHLARGCPGLAA